ncbi:hypothetical protein Prudu_448S000300 [Prunus dulcis]|uniref:Uncharacterized protein n=1 Tax=Prunus dulcis TaxID=3755 RepID=A0A5H2XJZ3_PRUDU|nr:hypothetical protein Prudu_448S000300 [Prunus dulcis]
MNMETESDNQKTRNKNRGTEELSKLQKEEQRVLTSDPDPTLSDPSAPSHSLSAFAPYWREGVEDTILATRHTSRRT